jgi:hypothetical protein
VLDDFIAPLLVIKTKQASVAQKLCIDACIHWLSVFYCALDKKEFIDQSCLKESVNGCGSTFNEQPLHISVTQLIQQRCKTSKHLSYVKRFFTVIEQD